MRIRPIVDADFDACVALWLEASLSTHGFLGRQTLIDDQVLVRELYLPNAETFIAVAEAGDDAAPAGFISLIGDFIGGLFVAPCHQRRDVGSALLEHAIMLGRARALEVYAANRAARAFYRRHGFVEAGTRPCDDLGRPFEVLILELPDTKQEQYRGKSLR